MFSLASCRRLPILLASQAEFYTLKELEKIAPKRKGVGMFCFFVVEELVLC